MQTQQPALNSCQWWLPSHGLAWGPRKACFRPRVCERVASTSAGKAGRRERGCKGRGEGAWGRRCRQAARLMGKAELGWAAGGRC